MQESNTQELLEMLDAEDTMHESEEPRIEAQDPKQQGVWIPLNVPPEPVFDTTPLPRPAPRRIEPTPAPVAQPAPVPQSVQKPATFSQAFALGKPPLLLKDQRTIDAPTQPRLIPVVRKMAPPSDTSRQFQRVDANTKSLAKAVQADHARKQRLLERFRNMRNTTKSYGYDPKWENLAAARKAQQEEEEENEPFVEDFR